MMQGVKAELAEAGYSGVLLGGNYVAGVALGKCVEFGYEYAKQIEQYLQSKQDSVGITPLEAQDDVFYV